MSYNHFPGPPVPVADPPLATEPPVSPNANRAAMRAQRIREFLAANPGRRGAPMGRPPAVEPGRSNDMPSPTMIAGGDGMPKPPVTNEGVAKPDPMLIPKPGMLQKPDPRTNAPLDKARLRAALGTRRLGGP